MYFSLKHTLEIRGNWQA